MSSQVGVGSSTILSNTHNEGGRQKRVIELSTLTPGVY